MWKLKMFFWWIIVFFSFFLRVFIFAVGIIPNFLRVLYFTDGENIRENRKNLSPQKLILLKKVIVALFIIIKHIKLFMKRLENFSFFARYGISTNIIFFGTWKKPVGMILSRERLTLKVDVSYIKITNT